MTDRAPLPNDVADAIYEMTKVVEDSRAEPLARQTALRDLERVCERYGMPLPVFSVST
jgi:hypothetical protein